MFSEIGASMAVTDFVHMHNGKVYEDLFPIDYTKRNGRSQNWHGDFIDRICRLFADYSTGKVYLISKLPDGPCSTRSVWCRIEFPALKANPVVESVILVSYENFQQQETLWARGSSQQSQRRYDVRAFSADVEDTCFIMSYTSDYRSWLPSGEQVDLTPILGAAAGWASVSVIQRKCCSPSRIHKLDVSIINARGVTIGQVTDVDAPPVKRCVFSARRRTPSASLPRRETRIPWFLDIAVTNGQVTIIPLSINANSAIGEKTAQGKGTAFSTIKGLLAFSFFLSLKDSGG